MNPQFAVVARVEGRVIWCDREISEREEQSWNAKTNISVFFGGILMQDNAVHP